MNAYEKYGLATPDEIDVMIWARASQPDLDPRRDGMITASHAGEICRDKSGKGWGRATGKVSVACCPRTPHRKNPQETDGQRGHRWGP